MLPILVIAIMAMAANARAADPNGPSYACSGNEPFWRIEMNPASAVLTRPGVYEIEAHVFAGRLDALDFLDPPWRVWRGRKAGGSGGDLVVVAREEPCQDTMADEAVFDHRAVVSFPENNVATGCCQAIADLSPAGAPPADFAGEIVKDAARLWPDFKSAIDVCLADAPGNAPVVVKAWPIDRERTGVQLADDSGRRFDCIVINGPNKVERIEAVAADASAQPGQSVPLFLPSSGPPPRVTCGRLSRVVDYRGATAGYLHDRGGCSRK
ncbi:MAG: hypothetical protein ACXW34_10990 [Nitrospira sp.]